MNQKEDEILEDYVQRFHYNHRRSKIKLDKPTLENIFLKGVREEWTELLNLMGGGDISCETFDNICELCRRYSRGIVKNIKSV